jgi:hypothetical protein
MTIYVCDLFFPEDYSEYEGDGGGDNAPGWEKEHDSEVKALYNM